MELEKESLRANKRKNLIKVDFSGKTGCFKKDVLRNYFKKNRIKRGEFLV